MIICPNCSTRLSCSCKERVASDGRKVCTSCLRSYEDQLIQKRLLAESQKQTP